MSAYSVKINLIYVDESKRRHCSVEATFLLPQFIRHVLNLIVIMGKKCDLTSNEKSTIVSDTGKEKQT